MFRFQSLEEDCPLEEEREALHVLVDEDDDIDQFNDDTFGSGAIDGDWREEHNRLAELDEKVGGTSPLQAPPPPAAAPAPSSLPHLYSRGLGETGTLRELDSLLLGGDENLAHSLSKLVLSAETDYRELEDPAIMRAGLQQHKRAPLQPRSQLNSGSIWDNAMGLGGMSIPKLSQVQDSPLMSIIKEVGLPKRPPMGRDEGRDLSERAPPPRSTSPVIGSPPVRAVPIGTPPKYPIGHNLNQQVLCPTPVHVRASMQQRFSSAFNDRMSPNQLLNIANSQLRGHPFPPCVGPVLTQLQRAQMIGAGQPARLSPSHFSLNPALLQGRMGAMMSPAVRSAGFRPFFSPSQGPPVRPGHNARAPQQHGAMRGDTTHLHPQHRRLLTQRMQQQTGRGQNGAGGDRPQRLGGSQDRRRDPYSNLMTSREKEWVSRIQMMQLQSTDPYLDDYYYQNYFEKLEKRPSPMDSNGDAHKREHTKLITPQVAKLEHAYRPVQFAGSLGKLTVSSVNNPRKMIDTVVMTTRSDDEEKKEKQVWNKRRQILYTVEKTYSLLLDIQDFERKYLQTPEEERGALLEERRSKVGEMFENLRGRQTDADRNRFSDDHFLQIMRVRKGKLLVSRLLPFLSMEHAVAVVMATARNLPYIAKKDAQDEVLPWLIEPFSIVIQHLASGPLTELLQDLSGLPGSPSELNSSTGNQQQAQSHTSTGQLGKVLTSKFGLTLLYLILSQGERLQSADSNTELMENNRWTELVFGVTAELLNIPEASLAQPVLTPPSLLSFFSHYVDRQRLNLLQDKLQLSPKPR
ncbi:protein PAT1 homolog 1-like [Acipenser ruthenus]|uniref:protein PAT1 homolog 1-like n=1 Tax=Acipenser ruthenus TaxID=7906 RepID=UPI002742917C|nr:protein PAT1 homolog 1-like [Acipenser ruthenus]